MTSPKLQLRKIIREEVRREFKKISESRKPLVKGLDAVTLTPGPKQILDKIIKDGYIEDDYDSNRIAVLESIEYSKDGNRLDITYRFYNREFENGGYQIKAGFIGDLHSIISSLNHLIFYSIPNKKNRYAMRGADIKIDYRVNNTVSNKYRYQNLRIR